MDSVIQEQGNKVVFYEKKNNIFKISYFSGNDYNAYFIKLER